MTARRLAWLAAGAVGAVAVRRWYARARTRRALWDGTYWRGRSLPVHIRASLAEAGEIVLSAHRHGYPVDAPTRDGDTVVFTVMSGNSPPRVP